MQMDDDQKQTAKASQEYLKATKLGIENKCEAERCKQATTEGGSSNGLAEHLKGGNTASDPLKMGDYKKYL